MTLDSTRAPIQGVGYSAEDYRLDIQSLLGGVDLGVFSGGVSATDPSHGVADPASFKVTQNGTPNMSVNVAAGSAFVRGTESALQGCYPVQNDDTVNVTIAAADSTNPRWDIVGIRIYDSTYGSSDPVDDGAFIEVVTGTPAASPADPTLPANFLALARVVVAASDTSITTGEITDLRNRAWTPMNGGVRRLASKKDTNNRNGFTSTATEVHSSLRCTVNVLNSTRVLRVKVSGVLTLSSGSGGALLSVRESGSAIQTIWQHASIAGSGHSFYGEIEIENPTAGAHTYQLFIAETGASGTLNVTASSSFPTRMTVDDAGPSA